MRISGTMNIPLVLCTDSYSLYAACSKQEASPGVDASMLYHVKALRALLDIGSLRSLSWIDNRDMVGDGLTKGKPSRDPMNSMVNSGTWKLQQPRETWCPRVRTHDINQHLAINL